MEVARDSDEELYQESESSDDERGWVKEVKKQHKMIRHKREQDVEQDDDDNVKELHLQPTNTAGVRSFSRTNK